MAVGNGWIVCWMVEIGLWLVHYESIIGMTEKIWLTLVKSQLSAGKYWKKYPHLDALKVAHFCPRLQEIAPFGIQVSKFPGGACPRTPLAGRACRTHHATVSSYFSPPLQIPESAPAVSTEQSRLRILWHGSWVSTEENYSWSLLKSYFCPIFVVQNPTFVLFFLKILILYFSYIFIWVCLRAWERPESDLVCNKHIN